MLAGVHAQRAYANVRSGAPDGVVIVRQFVRQPAGLVQATDRALNRHSPPSAFVDGNPSASVENDTSGRTTRSAASAMDVLVCRCAWVGVLAAGPRRAGRDSTKGTVMATGETGFDDVT
jgi:hypothetical protein